MSSLFRRFRRARDGQALVEFALMAPIALLLIMAVWEFGRGWNAYQVITDAAREGARVGVISNADQTIPDDSVSHIINNRLFRAAMDSTLETTTVTGLKAGTAVPLTVSISYPYRISYVGALLQWTTGEKTVVLRTSFTMRNE